MILVNRNFGNPVLSEVIGDMFKSTSNTDQPIDWVPNTGALTTGSTLVSTLTNKVFYSRNLYPGNGVATTTIAVTQADTIADATTAIKPFVDYNNSPKNMFLVTEKFIKTLDKVYTKIWNESFTETGIYTSVGIASLYSGFVTDNSAGSGDTNFMNFKKFVDRCITAGILVESDRLQYEDQISLNDLNRADLSTQIDLNNKLITFTLSKPVDIKPDLNALATPTVQYLNGKKLFLMMTPYLTNESIVKNQTATSGQVTTQEPFNNYIATAYDTNSDTATNWNWSIKNTPVKRPIAFFKPKTDASKFGRSLPLATHFFWSLGTPADKALAETNGTTPPDLVFDHLDRISHIDSLVLKIKFDKLQF